MQEQRLAAQPLVQLGSYLDAAAAVLKGNTSDTQALKDYSFAVSRAVEVVKNSGIEPWKTLRQTGSWVRFDPGGTWCFPKQARSIMPLNQRRLFTHPPPRL
jgi:hypothetical protein